MTHSIDLAIKFLTAERDAGRQFKSYEELPQSLRMMIAETTYALKLKPIDELRAELMSMIPKGIARIVMSEYIIDMLPLWTLKGVPRIK